MLPGWLEEPVAKRHDRSGFRCGEPALDEFLALYARQSHERGAAKTFVAADRTDRKTIHGYYTLSPASVAFARIPPNSRLGLARHEVGAFRLARLAVSARLQGQGLGGQLLMAAGQRCQRVAQEVGGSFLLIDAKNERAAAWYGSLGATALLDAPLALILPLATIAQASR